MAHTTYSKASVSISKGYWRSGSEITVVEHKKIIEILLLGLDPCKVFLTTTPVYLDEHACNMGESQHEPVIEIGKDQEDLKLNECCGG
jgi:hypothetical protein